jgi:hypothetical protein
MAHGPDGPAREVVAYGEERANADELGWLG